jgi:hypothetical protein
VARSCGDRAPSFTVSSARAAPCSVLVVSFILLVWNKAVQQVRHLISSLPPNRTDLAEHCLIVKKLKNMILCSYSWVLRASLVEL